MGAFDEFERHLDDAVSVADGVPGAVFLALDRNGNTLYAKSAGKCSIGPDAKDMAMDTVFWMASFTKLITAVAVMQCVERGLLALDEPVGRILPEYAEPLLLQGFDENDEPILQAARQPLTLRHLLTHSSGLSYDLFDPKLIKWSKRLGRKENQQSGTLEGLRYPLLFEPGTGFCYGSGVDWAGQMVERVNGQMTLEKYCRINIWGPLGLNHTTFNISSQPQLLNKLVGMVGREPSGSLIELSHRPRDVGAQICSGGSGLYGTAGDFAAVLAQIINGGGLLLKPETAEEMFRPQFQDPKYLQDHFDQSSQGQVNIPPYWGESAPLQYGLSFLINTKQSVTGRATGSAQWAGMANTFWWADSSTGVVGVIMAQITPFQDHKILELYQMFELGVYKSIQEKL